MIWDALAKNAYSSILLVLGAPEAKRHLVPLYSREHWFVLVWVGHRHVRHLSLADSHKIKLDKPIALQAGVKIMYFRFLGWTVPLALLSYECFNNLCVLFHSSIERDSFIDSFAEGQSRGCSKNALKSASKTSTVHPVPEGHAQTKTKLTMSLFQKVVFSSYLGESNEL